MVNIAADLDVTLGLTGQPAARVLKVCQQWSTYCTLWSTVRPIGALNAATNLRAPPTPLQQARMWRQLTTDVKAGVPDLAPWALVMLAAPVSNARVEGVYSIVSHMEAARTRLLMGDTTSSPRSSSRPTASWCRSGWSTCVAASPWCSWVTHRRSGLV